MQNFKLFISQHNFFTVYKNHVAGNIHGNQAVGKLARFVFFYITAQYRFNTRYHFHHAERFGNIIVCTAVKPVYFVELRTFSRSHDNRDVRSALITAQAF